ncbi:unnamed protein product (macronuclear) [Paramecium tetraurelia]|uniref:BING4 C-terminal domain-containing protein n=1 Tax=Paramecium tetraurelia TaxID=5888 RepID=A0DRM4_PARTE|nr:uncharacterized protein GSPATT00019409001 [Paramecium tetraurelia]CAK85691.1 unnamed protein product [Paramecium tetraurelia]|eukprot:XP_001453088.1 hypothetical protein (macronuclear) [Paramecium tetraurelia strain d4-2]
MAKDKILSAKLKQQEFKTKSTHLKTQKIAQLLEPQFQQSVEIDDERPLLKISNFKGVFTQKRMCKMQNLYSLNKIINLKLKQGPYKALCDTLNNIFGQENLVTQPLLIGDTKKCYDIISIAQRNFAVAQKSCIYIYDPKGVEVHKIRECKQATKLEYLPYHFLLAALNQNGQLTYQDITQGKNNIKTTPSPLCLKQNNNNAILGIGDQNGSCKGCTLLILELRLHPLMSMTFSRDGNHLITTGSEGTIKVWDLRTQKLQSQVAVNATNIALSDKGILAAGRGTDVVMWKNCLIGDLKTPYLRYKASSMICDIDFIKHEDYLAMSTFDSYEQTVVPESGEAFFDTYEQPELQNKKQRLETNVRQLLEKLPPESISLQSHRIGTIDRTSKVIIEKEQKRQLEEQASRKIKKQKKKMRGRNKIGKREKLKELERDQKQQVKWQEMLSDALRVKRAEKEKKKFETKLLDRLEQIPSKEFIRVVS